MATLSWDPGYTKALTIASGNTDSDILDLDSMGARRVMTLLFFVPSAVVEVITIHVAPVDTGTFLPYFEGGFDVVLTAGKATKVDGLNAGALKLVASGAVGGDRTITLQGNTRQ